VTGGAAPAALLALTAAALGSSACGSTVDRKDLETKIADFVHKQTGTTVAVRCPDGVDAKKGTRVHCTTELSGTTTDLDIVFTQDGRFRITSARPRTS
jgi:hypothetical protein